MGWKKRIRKINNMDVLGIIYLAIGAIIATIFHINESRKVSVIDESVANITTMFVWLLWPVVILTWLIVSAIKWIQIH